MQADAIIFELRENGGGSPGIVALLAARVTCSRVRASFSPWRFDQTKGFSSGLPYTTFPESLFLLR